MHERAQHEERQGQQIPGTATEQDLVAFPSWWRHTRRQNHARNSIEHGQTYSWLVAIVSTGTGTALRISLNTVSAVFACDLTRDFMIKRCSSRAGARYFTSSGCT